MVVRAEQGQQRLPLAASGWDGEAVAELAEREGSAAFADRGKAAGEGQALKGRRERPQLKGMRGLISGAAFLLPPSPPL